jgi:biofilm PGA synthesis N-glycosyltransferase PgaC
MDYFDKLLGKFKANEHLGITGGWIHELKNHIYKGRFGNTNKSVPGAIQMFKRECFETINGYIPLRRGGEEYVAEVMARLQGWEAKSFPDLKVFHRRRTGAENGNILYRRYNMGMEDYFIGYHPLFEVFKIIRKIKEEPYFIGSIFRMIGYLNGFLERRPILIPYELVKVSERNK